MALFNAHQTSVWMSGKCTIFVFFFITMKCIVKECVDSLIQFLSFSIFLTCWKHLMVLLMTCLFRVFMPQCWWWSVWVDHLSVPFLRTWYLRNTFREFLKIWHNYFTFNGTYETFFCFSINQEHAHCHCTVAPNITHVLYWDPQSDKLSLVSHIPRNRKVWYLDRLQESVKLK